MEFILALPAQKGGGTDVKKPKAKNTEADNNRKRLIEDDLQMSGNELGTRNTKKREIVPTVSLDFQKDYGKKGVSDLHIMFGMKKHFLYI